MQEINVELEERLEMEAIVLIPTALRTLQREQKGSARIKEVEEGSL
jgi:hypothetical protein